MQRQQRCVPHVERFLQGICAFCQVWVHATRMRALMAAVGALFRCNSLSVSTLGRALPGKPKQGIKRIDRLLSNTHLVRDTPRFYEAISHTVIAEVERPILLMDWTKVADGFSALTTSVALDGRSIAIYTETHPVSKQANARVEKAYLKSLRNVLPQGSCPLIVADAGFGSAFFKLVHQTMGWDFVVRLRGTRTLQEQDSTAWVACSDLHDTATLRPRELGMWRVCKTRSKELYRLVTVRKRRRDQRKRTTATGSFATRGYMKRSREPWLLATSLPQLDADAAAVITLYSKRMQIEENFRDLKSHRFGWSLSYVRCSCAQRLNVLLLIASLAMVAALILGRIAEQKGIHRKYQGNTVKNRRVLSFFSLGTMILQRGDTEWLALNNFHVELCAMRELFNPAYVASQPHENT